MRLFIALHLEPATLALVRALQTQLRAADAGAEVRWVDPAGMHLTLKFLGETEEGRVEPVTRALGAAVARRAAPRLALSAVGGFPNLRRPRVLWVGLREEGESLVPLQQAVEAAMATLGWEAERRPFQPHLTLGRRREESGRSPQPLAPGLEKVLGEVPPFTGKACAHGRLALVRSHLEPRGARYQDLVTWSLAGP